MSYAHIENMYRPEGQDILIFRECFALEKVDGTSSRVSWREGVINFSGGCVKAVTFAKIFDEPALRAAFEAMGHPSVTVYGEAYGGSVQKMAHRYGPAVKFVAFEVQVGETWLSVPQAAAVVATLGLEFVHYVKVSTDLAALDAERDAPSEQSRRNGMGEHRREGVVLRPLIELRKNDGSRVMCKHKRPEERETATPRPVVDPSQLAVLENATQIAFEWATEKRLEHILNKLELDGASWGLSRTRDVITAMTEDVLREGAGEIVDSKEARAAIGKRTAEIFKAHLKAKESV